MKTLFLLAMLLCMAACQKSTAPDRSHVGGRILEYGTDTPIEGAKVNISGWSGSIGGGGSGGGHTAGSTTYSDRDGYYSFDDLNGSGVLLVNATKEDYFTDLDTEESVLDDGNYDDVDVRLKPYAWLKVTIRNESGAYAISSSEINTSFPLQQMVGSDTTFLQLVKGNREYKYVYSIWSQPNQATTYSRIQYCTGHDTTSITITY